MIATSAVEFGPYRIHLLRAGSGDDLVLVHGIGPGTSIVANFGPVLDRLANSFRVTGIDLIGFGGSSRKKEPPFFDVELWVEQVAYVLGKLNAERIALLGHSAGGAIALKIAARERRVSHVISSAGAGSALAVNRHLARFWQVPSSIAELGEMVTGTVYDRAQVTDDVLKMRFETFRDEGGAEYFRRMFADDKQKLIDSLILNDDELGRVSAHVLFLHGRDDLPCPVEETALPLWSRLKGADLTVFGRCGHSIPRESPYRFARAVEDFVLG